MTVTTKNYRAIVLFGAFIGERPQAMTARLTVGQFRTTVSQKRPVIDVPPEQDKIRMQHYCPIHRQVVDAVGPVLSQVGQLTKPACCIR